jgi:uncharacterized protein (DUF1501 family)
MQRFHGCNRAEHVLSRRQFLTGGAAGLGMLGLSDMIRASGEIQRQQKRVLVIFLAGGVSQLETWDPKPGTNTGGPFQAIPTSVPGVHISELLPQTALQMHRMALVRGVNTNQDDHGEGQYIMETGRRRTPGEVFPHVGSAMAKLLGSEANPLPGYMHISPGSGAGSINRNDAAFLGPRFACVNLPDGTPPANLNRPPTLTELADSQRDAVRIRANARFLETRRNADTEAYTNSYEQAAQVMSRHSIFDLSREPMSIRDRYGNHEFGRHCLLARRLLDAGVTFVKVTHSNYDSHHENFDFHIEQLGEFDSTFANLLEDLAQRGMLESTLVVVMSEFGRTPTINANMGRDHWSRAWSVALAGCGIKGGAVVGRTNANGTEVVDRQVHGGHLFHTYLRAVGLNSRDQHNHDGRPIPMADPQADTISEVLA